MKNRTPYLRMRIRGAIETSPGDTTVARVKAASQMNFTDEEGNQRRFTWRTIQTWYSRFKKHGMTVMENKVRSDAGKPRKIKVEDVLEAIRQARPKLRGKGKNTSTLRPICLKRNSIQGGVAS